MALNFSIVERFVSEYSDRMHDRTLLRHDRYNILVELRKTLWNALRESERFESEFTRVLDSIDTTSDFEDLRRYHAASVEGIRIYFQEEQTIADVNDLFRLVRDRLTIRILSLVEEEMAADGFGIVPSAYCWVGLGSEGRDEQTFVTDQDNMLIYHAPSDEARLIERYYEELSRRAMERLHQVGFEKCKGGIMPSSAKWRGSVSDWRARIEETLTQGKGTLDLLDLIVLTDARVIHGDRALFKTVIDQFFALLRENRHVLKEITEVSVVMPTALGFFGKFKVESTGEHQGRFNLKVLGWSPLVMSVRALALAEGLYETNTIERIKRLRAMNIVKKEMAEDLIDAYLLFARFRVMDQLGRVGPDGSNYIDPAALSGEETGRLRRAMRTVEAFQKYLHEVVLFGQPL